MFVENNGKVSCDLINMFSDNSQKYMNFMICSIHVHIRNI